MGNERPVRINPLSSVRMLSRAKLIAGPTSSPGMKARRVSPSRGGSAPKLRRREITSKGKSNAIKPLSRITVKPAASTLRRSSARVYRRLWRAASSCALQREGCCGTVKRTPPSGLSALRRNVTLIRRTAVTVQDTYSFESPPTNLQWHLITPSHVSQPEKGWIHLTSSSTVGDLVSADGWIHFNPDVVEVSQETIEIEDERMSGFWGARLYRINLTARSSKAEGSFDLRVTKHK